MKNEEDFYQNYREEKSNEENIDNKNIFNNNENKNKKKIFLYGGLIVLLIIILSFLAILIINKSKEKNDEDIKADITLNQQSLSIAKGNRSVINITRNTEDILITWTSTNEDVVTVDSGGNVTAIDFGNASIILSYTGSDGKKYELECAVIVAENDDPTNPTDPTDYEMGLSYTFNQGKENTWTKNDVVISLNPVNSSYISSIKYAINCTNNCSYSNVSNNKINISKEGNNKITVIATYKNNKTVLKDIVVKIDKTAPTCVVNSKKVTDSGVSISVTGSDKLSGIKTINGNSYSTDSATYSTTLKTAKANELVVVDNASNETKCSKITTVMCYQYDHTTSCKYCYAAGVRLVSGPSCTTYSSYQKPSPILTDSEAKNQKVTTYYKSCTMAPTTSTSYYTCSKCTYKWLSNSSCSACGADKNIETLYSNDGNLKSTTTEYYMIKENTKICLDNCNTGCK